MRYFSKPSFLKAIMTGLMAIGITGAAAPMIQAATIPAPYAHWKLDETAGTTAADSSGHNRAGTYKNSPTLGVDSAYPSLGTAIELAGDTSGEQIQLADATVGLGQVTQNFTITGWVNVHEFYSQNYIFTSYRAYNLSLSIVADKGQQQLQLSPPTKYAFCVWIGQT